MKVHKSNICTHPYEGNAFLYDVSAIVGTLLCGYCAAIKNYNLECQTLMKVLHFCMMLIAMYILYCVDIAFLYDVSSNAHTSLREYCEVTKDYNLEYQT
jgi:sugar phosphate permease